MSSEAEKAQRLIGNISAEQMINVEAFTGNNAGIYIPSTGHCKYSISEDHTHPAFSFFYSLEHDVQVVIEGKKAKASAGRIYCIPPGIVHHEVEEERFVRFVAILIDPGFFSYHAEDYSPGIDLGRVQNFRSTESVRGCVRDFIGEVSGNAPGCGKLIDALEIRLAHSLLRGMSGDKIPHSRASERLDIERVIEHIQNNFDRNVSLEEMASIVALSPSHFSRLFKKETGIAPQDYVIDIRLKRTRNLLLKTEKNLTEIAHLCGFANSAHFSSSFSRRFGITPSRFRKSI